MVCEQGDIVYVNFEPTIGHEPNKTRPALVVSADEFNMRCSLTAVCPITSTDNGYPLHIFIDTEEVRGFACIEAVRTIDLTARRCEKVGIVDETTMGKVLGYIGSVFGI